MNLQFATFKIICAVLLFGFAIVTKGENAIDFDNRLIEFIVQANEINAIQLKNEYGVFEYKKLR